MAKDILDKLPPDTIISGAVGDSRLHVEFKTTASEARSDIVKVCERHATLRRDGWGLDSSVTPSPAYSYYFYSEVKAEIPGVLGLVLLLDTGRAFGKHTDIRTDPWIVEQVVIEYNDFATYNSDPDPIAAAAKHCQAIVDILSKLRCGGDHE